MPARFLSMLTLRRSLVVLVANFVAISTGFAAARDADLDGPHVDPIGLGVGAAGVIIALVAVMLAIRAQKRAEQAAQEAGEARARANQGAAGNVSSESVAGLERVWATRIAALEARLPQGGSSRATPAREGDHASSNNVSARVEELERVVAGLTISLKEQRRSGSAATTAAARESSDVVWPHCLAAETSAMGDVRQTLAQALKAKDQSATDLLVRLRVTDQWLTQKPSNSEVSSALSEISILLLSALRKGAAVAPLDGSLLSDRVLAALRPSWKPFLPHLDCRSFYPGATFDPEWMEDYTKSGAQRPVIAEMLSWAVFEKHEKGRRILAKARVSSE